MRLTKYASALILTLAMGGAAAEAGKSDAPAADAKAGAFGDYHPQGFMSDYSGMKAVAEEKSIYRYRNPDVDGSKYAKVMVDRIKVFVKENAEYKGIDPAELHELVTYFHDAIEKALGDAYPLVTKPGPDVLRLRIAVTDLVPNKPSASVVSLVVPFLWVGEAGAGAAEGNVGSTPFLGEATIELEALDSESSTRVAAYIETRIGKKYNWVEGVETGVKDYIKAYSTWDYTKQAFDHWAQLIRTRLDEVHGKASEKK
jgi:hypothetical protein